MYKQHCKFDENYNLIEYKETNENNYVLLIKNYDSEGNLLRAKFENGIMATRSIKNIYSEIVMGFGPTQKVFIGQEITYQITHNGKLYMEDATIEDVESLARKTDQEV